MPTDQRRTAQPTRARIAARVRHAAFRLVSAAVLTFGLSAPHLLCCPFERKNLPARVAFGVGGVGHVPTAAGALALDGHRCLRQSSPYHFLAHALLEAL